MYCCIEQYGVCACVLKYHVLCMFTCCRPCLCGVKDAGCFWCGACRRCANVELPPGHPLQQHATWNYASARERVRNLFTTSYKGPLSLTGQGEVADQDGGSKWPKQLCYALNPNIFTLKGHSQQAALTQALQQLRDAVSGEHWYGLRRDR